MDPGAKVWFVFLWSCLSVSCWNPQCRFQEEENVIPSTIVHQVQTYNKTISITDFLFGVSFPNDSVGYVVGANGTIYKSVDSSNSFFSLNSTTTQHLFDAYFTNSNNGFVVGNGLTFLKTNNGGSSWSNVTLPSSVVSTANFRKIVARNSSVVFALGGDGSGNATIVKSMDGGTTWSDLFWPGIKTVYGMDFISDDTAVVSTAGAEVYRTNNGGSSWSQMTVNTGSTSIYPILLGDVKMMTNKIGFIVGFASGVYDDRFILKTTDGGYNWNRINIGLTEGASDVYTDLNIINSNEIVITGGSVNDNVGFVIRSKDGGITWAYETIPSVPRLYKSSNINGSEFFVGNNGTVLKRY